MIVFHEIVRWVERRRTIATCTAKSISVTNAATAARIVEPSLPSAAENAVASTIAGTTARATRCQDFGAWEVRIANASITPIKATEMSRSHWCASRTTVATIVTAIRMSNAP